MKRVHKGLALLLAAILTLSSLQQGSIKAYAAEESLSTESISADEQGSSLESTEPDVSENGEGSGAEEDAVLPDAEEGTDDAASATAGEEDSTLPADEDEETDLPEAADEGATAATLDSTDAEEVVEEQEEALSEDGDIVFHLDANGGAFDENGSKVLEVDYEFINLISYRPDREGYAFTGWYFDQACTNRASTVENNDELEVKYGDPDYKLNPLDFKERYNGKMLYAGWTTDIVTVTFYFGTESGSDPYKNTGYYWYGRGYGDKEKVKSYSIKMQSGSAISKGDIPEYEKIGNDDFHYMHEYTDYRYGNLVFYKEFDRINKYDFSTPVTSDLQLYAGYMKNRHVITFHTGSDMAYFQYPEYGVYENSGRYSETIYKAEYRITDPEKKGSFSFYLDNNLINLDPTKTVEGVYDNPEFTGEKYEKSKTYTVKDDLDLYIKWTDSNAKILTLDPNGGYFKHRTDNSILNVFRIAIEPGEEKQYNTSEYRVVPNDLHKILMGWAETKTAKKAQYGDENSSGGTYIYTTFGNEDKTLYAVWENRYNLANFHLMGGKLTSSPYGAIYDENGDFILREEKSNEKLYVGNIGLEKDGYVFGGWYTDEECKVPADADYNSLFLKEDTDFYAKWRKIHTVTFDYGEGRDKEGKTSGTLKVTDGMTILESGQSIPSNPESSSADKAFKSWYKDNERIEAVGSDEIINTVITKDTVFYAGYAPSLTVTFDPMGGKFSNGSTAPVLVKVPQGDPIGGRYPNVRVEADKVFGGWFLEKDENGNVKKDSEIKNVSAYVVNENVTFYASFADCYTVTFHANRTGASIDGKSDIKIKVIKGEPLRYGADSEESDLLWNCPTVADEPVNGKYPLIHRDYSYSTPAWSLNADGTGNWYYFNEKLHATKGQNDAYTTQIGTSEGFVPTKNMDFYLVWNDPMTITFDAGKHKLKLSNDAVTEGGVLSEDRTKLYVTVAKGTAYGEIRAQEKYFDIENSSSFNWQYTDAKFTKTVDYSKPIWENTTFYGKRYEGGGGSTSKWIEITFNSSEGYFGNASTKTERHSYQPPYTVSVDIPIVDDPDKAFSGWYTDEACKKPYDASLQAFKEGVSYVRLNNNKIKNLYAGYSDARSVTFDANGGYFDKNTGRVKDPEQSLKDITLITEKELYAGKGVSVTEYTQRVRRDGDRIFSGWYLDKECTQKAPLTSFDSEYTYFVPKNSNVTLYAGWKEYKLPTEIKLEGKDYYELSIGEVVQLSASIRPEGTGELRWILASNYTDSASKTPAPAVILNSDGKLIANASGYATVFAEYNGVISETIGVRIKNKTVSSSIFLTIREVNLVKNESTEVYATVVPETSASSVVWTSSDNSVATVEGSGAMATITAGGKEGKATITAALGKLKATLTVNVAVPIRVFHTELVVTAKEGAFVTNSASVTSESLKNKPVAWSVDDTEALKVEVDENDSRYVKLTPNTTVTEKKEVNLTATVIADDGTKYSDHSLVIVNPMPKLSAPVFDVEPGTVKRGTKVQIHGNITDEQIFVKIDDGEYEAYDNPIEITQNTTITAISKKAGYLDSAEVVAEYIADDSWGDISDGERFEFRDIDDVPKGLWYLIDNIFAEASSDSATALDSASITYTGDKVTFGDNVEVFHGTDKLVENRDYTVKYSNNKVAAWDDDKKAPTLTITGKGNYSKKAVFTFSISPAHMVNTVLNSEERVAVAAGSKAKLSNVKPELTYNGKKLVLNKDYVLKYYSDEELKNEVQATEVIDVPGKTYYIRPVAKDGGNFYGKGQIITAVGVDSKSAVSVGKLKVTDDKGKALKLEYNSENEYDATLLFDNSSEGKDPKAFVMSGKTVLTYGTDYTVKPVDEDDYKSAGIHRVVIVGTERALTEEQVKNGEKSYVGEKVFTFEIAGISLKSVKIAGLLTSVQYKGAEIEYRDLFNPQDKVVKSRNAAMDGSGEPISEVLLYYKTKKDVTDLKAGTDYTYSMDNTGNVGKFTLTFTGTGKYTGTISKTISVKAFDVKKNVGNAFEVRAENAVYTKTGAKPSVTVTFGGRTLKEGVDYTLTYKNNSKIVASEQDLDKMKASARPTVTVKGKGNFTGANAQANFLISKAPATNITLVVNDVTFNEKGKKGYMLVKPKLMEGGKAVSAGKNKDVEALSKNPFVYTFAEDTVLTNKAGDPMFTMYAGSRIDPGSLNPEAVIPAGTLIRVEATVKCSEKSCYTAPEDGAVISGYYRIAESGKDISKFSVSIKNAADLAYNDGESVVPLKAKDIVVSYKVKGQKTPVTLEPEYYEVVSVTNNRLVGTATVTIRGRNGYAGSKSFTFKIGAKAMNN